MTILKAEALTSRQNGLLMFLMFSCPRAWFWCCPPSWEEGTVPKQPTFVFPSFNPEQLLDVKENWFQIFKGESFFFPAFLSSSFKAPFSSHLMLSENNQNVSGLFCISWVRTWTGLSSWTSLLSSGMPGKKTIRIFYNVLYTYVPQEHFSSF